jgi:hypothetical protein
VSDLPYITCLVGVPTNNTKAWDRADSILSTFYVKSYEYIPIGLFAHMEE